MNPPVKHGLRAGCGCVFALILMGITAGYIFFDYSIASRLRRTLADAPVGWTDTIRVRFRLPDMTGLLLEGDLAGDAAPLLRDSLQWDLAYPEHAFRSLIGKVQVAEGDTAMWRAVRRSPTPDAYVRAARMRDWEATRRLIAISDPAAATNLMALESISYRNERSATRGLLIRGILRLRSGDRAGARSDIAAATTLGYRLAAREPTPLGFYVGRSAIGASMAGWLQLAEVLRDTALARRARAIEAWATDDAEFISSKLVAAPDSALALAGDSSLALGLRVEALRSAIGGWLLRPRGFLFGPPRSIVEELHRQATASSDPDYAMLASIAALTAARMNLLTVTGMFREAAEP